MTVGLFVGGQWDSQVAIAGKSSSLMDISTDGKLLVCTNRDNGTASVVDLQSHRKLHEIPLGAKPEGVTFLGDSHTVAAAVYAEDTIIFLMLTPATSLERPKCSTNRMESSAIPGAAKYSSHWIIRVKLSRLTSTAER
jgi:hypothetical protein